MSGSGYTSTCPRCGSDNMDCYSDSKPYEQYSALCLDCGFAIDTHTSIARLAEVNERRAEMDDNETFPPLTELRKPNSAWISWGEEPKAE